MHDPLTTQESQYRAVIDQVIRTVSPFHCDTPLDDQAVLSGILDHAYSDPVNEIIGHLGGHWTEDTHTAYVTHFSPSARVIEVCCPEPQLLCVTHGAGAKAGFR